MADTATAILKAEDPEDLDDVSRAYRDVFVEFDLDRDECITPAEYGAVAAEEEKHRRSPG